MKTNNEERRTKLNRAGIEQGQRQQLTRESERGILV